VRVTDKWNKKGQILLEERVSRIPNVGAGMCIMDAGCGEGIRHLHLLDSWKLSGIKKEGNIPNNNN
jgi:hypothetical protein